MGISYTPKYVRAFSGKGARDANESRETKDQRRNWGFFGRVGLCKRCLWLVMLEKLGVCRCLWRGANLKLTAPCGTRRDCGLPVRSAAIAARVRRGTCG